MGKKSYPNMFIWKAMKKFVRLESPESNTYVIFHLRQAFISRRVVHIDSCKNNKNPSEILLCVLMFLSARVF